MLLFLFTGPLASQGTQLATHIQRSEEKPEKPAQARLKNQNIQITGMGGKSLGNNWDILTTITQGYLGYFMIFRYCQFWFILGVVLTFISYLAEEMAPQVVTLMIHSPESKL